MLEAPSKTGKSPNVDPVDVEDKWTGLIGLSGAYQAKYRTKICTTFFHWVDMMI